MPQLSVYLVDDDDDDIYLARLTFKEYFPDWNLTSFSGGQELIDYLSEYTAHVLPGFMILDLNMPRLTGFETLARLKQHSHWKQIPVAILTTSSNAEDRIRSVELGACAFITKPATVEQLARVIVDNNISGQSE